MGWFKWKRTTPTPVAQMPFPVPPPEPEPERLTLLERFGRWRVALAAQAQTAPTRDEIEAEQARQAEERQAQADDHLAEHLARWGSWMPGDDFDQERRPESWPGTLPGSWWTRL